MHIKNIVASNKRIIEVSKDRAVLSMGITDIMKTYGIRHASAVKAKFLAERRMVSKGKEAVLEDIRCKRRLHKELDAMRGVAGRYPKLFTGLLTETNRAALAVRHQVTRQYAHYLAKRLKRLAVELNKTVPALVSDLESAG